MTDLDRFANAVSVMSHNSYNAAIEACAKIVENYLVAYPESIFHQPLQGQHGETIDACSAAALRAVLPHIIEDIRKLHKR